MAWVKPEFTREEINSAGKILVAARSLNDHQFLEFDWDRYDSALTIINNWRSSHGYPLISLRINLTNVARRFDSKALVAQRVKRLVSISTKLERFPKMKLSQMQDLGGCRAILNNVPAVQGAVEYYKSSSRMLHTLASMDDYIQEPKASGYRGVHLVYRFQSENRHKRPYNGLKIELQLRSAYQHAWATAVETVGTFSGQALKSSLGSEEWQTFFSLMGSEIALREKTPLVPGTPHTRAELRDAVRHYSETLKVRDRLLGYRQAVKAVSASPKKTAEFFLLQLDPSVGSLLVKGFDSIEEASKAYENAEKRVRDKEGTDAVLVSVDSVSALGKAYPNYFADTRVFMQLMTQALSGRSRGIEVSPVPIGVATKTDQLPFGESVSATDGAGATSDLPKPVPVNGT
jgi:RelA/SpoT family protein